MVGPQLPDMIAKRPLHFFWLADCSGSMAGHKIAMLNQAIREAMPAVLSALKAHPEVQIQVRAVKFSDNASWHIGPQSVELEKFTWPDLTAGGLTATAAAIRLLADELSIEKMPKRGFPPVCILISDGYCTDKDDESYASSIAMLDQQPWGKKAVRLSIAIGSESEYDENELLKFVNQQNVGLLKADSPEKLVEFIKWASVAASIGASTGKSKTGDESNTNVILPPPPTTIGDVNTVW